jgi:hypothetical protein
MGAAFLRAPSSNLPVVPKSQTPSPRANVRGVGPLPGPATRGLNRARLNFTLLVNYQTLACQALYGLISCLSVGVRPSALDTFQRAAAGTKHSGTAVLHYLKPLGWAHEQATPTLQSLQHPLSIIAFLPLGARFLILNSPVTTMSQDRPNAKDTRPGNGDCLYQTQRRARPR